jgi:hypothetical protein
MADNAVEPELETPANLVLSPTCQPTDNQMLVDEYERYHHDRTDDVVVSHSGSEEPEAEPSADDCKTLAIPALCRRRPSALCETSGFPKKKFFGGLDVVCLFATISQHIQLLFWE